MAGGAGGCDETGVCESVTMFIIWLKVMGVAIYLLIGAGLFVTSLAAGDFFWRDIFGKLGPWCGVLQALVGLGMVMGFVVYEMVKR